MLLHLYISLENFLLGANADCPAVNLPGLLKVIAPETEVSIKNPELAKGKFLMRN
jgi:hypothetical protein